MIKIIKAQPVPIVVALWNMKMLIWNYINVI